MKKLFSGIKVLLIAALAFVARSATALIAPYGPDTWKPTLGQLVRSKQGGYVLLGRSYAGYPAGQIVELPSTTEAALIASGSATLSAGPPTTGAVTTTAMSGCAAVAAGSSSVVITHASVTAQSQISATVAQAAADGTLLRVERIVCAAGSFTIYGTANATATTLIKWAVLNADGTMTKPV